MNKDIFEIIKNNELVTMDGYDDCIIGIGSRANAEERFVVYDTQKIIMKLVEEHNMVYHEAVEFYEFNQACVWHGSKTPAFVDTFE